MITKEQAIVKMQINNLKQQLSATDYQCLKYADGELSAVDYRPIREYRQELRNKINELEGKL